ncbi:MAG: hypothetical protein IPL61_32970 [Myxococcales bacterium]|nr:hypothetical protein [Myxococcales bacterium]
MESAAVSRRGRGLRVLRRLGLRFALLYPILYALPFPFDLVPPAEFAVEWYGERQAQVASWFGQLLLGVHVDPASPVTGSGDRPLDYVIVFTVAVLALLGAAVWTAVERRDRHDARLASIVRVFLRYAMAFTMLSYGLAKVYESQFPTPNDAWLSTRYGDSSPMRLLWTFMGASRPYSMFAGGLECLAGVLLLWRRTTTLGALVMGGVMLNVLMLNLCYDVPVKLYAAHLVVFAGVLAGPDLGRLASVLIANRPTTPRPPRTPLPRRWMERARLAVKAVVIVGGVYVVHGENRRMSVPPELRPYHAAFEVDEFRQAGTAVTTGARWAGWYPSWPGTLVVEQADGARLRFAIAADAVTSTVTLTLTPVTPADAAATTPPPAQVLQATWTDADHLILLGVLDGVATEVHLRRRAPWKLMTRGYHWVSPVPYNR